jgi:undecaprenyl-diphosphatase
MVQDLLALNWNLFEAVNGEAGHQTLLDPTMIFTANDLIFLLPLLLLLLWFALAGWSPLARSAPQAEATRLVGHVTLLLALLGAGIALGINIVIGNLLFEPRPFVSHLAAVHKLIPHAADASFPSDHMAISVGIVTVLVALAVLLVRRRLAGGLALFAALLAVLAALAIGFARVYVGVHYPGDVVGGALCGILGGLIALALRPLLARLLAPIIRLLARIGLA